MSVKIDLSRLSVGQFAERYRGEMIPLSSTFSYFCASVPLSEEDIREYLEEPIAALPPAVAARLPKISILLVPYLERANGKEKVKASDMISIERPPESRSTLATQLRVGNEQVLVFALKDQEVAEYHYRFYRLLASLTFDRCESAEYASFLGLLREELIANVHGEVDEESWRAKQSLLRRQPAKPARDSKLFQDYAKQAFIDTLTLYLHGICCDIDVETGPRQLPSRYLRKRLNQLRTLFTEPEGYAVFPEDLK